MAKLPFIVEPKLQPRTEIIGTEESGQIEIIRRGYLTAAERAFTQSQVSEEETTAEVVRLTRQVGTELKLDMQAAYELLNRVMTGDISSDKERKISEKYGEKISEIIQSMSQASERRVLVCALCMLVYRVNPEFDAEDLMELHPDLIDQLFALYTDEESRSTTRLVQVAESAGVEAAEATSIDVLEKK